MLLVNALGWGIVAKLDFMYVMAPKVTVIQPSKTFWYFSLEVLIICEIGAGVNGKGISNLRWVCPAHLQPPPPAVHGGLEPEPGIAGGWCQSKRINENVLDKQCITADTALRLARYFGIPPQFWMGLQND
jgi:hypothetical protein